MGLFRAGSAKSTLSLMQRRTTKYQKFLNISNVFLLIVSSILIFAAAILIKFYHLLKMDFWSAYFWIVPYLLIILGVYTFLVTVFGFLISGSEKRVLLIVYAALLSAAFVVQLISIFAALELRNAINSEEEPFSNTRDILKELDNWHNDSSVRDKWNSLQSDLHCCGAVGYSQGYTIYRGVKSLEGGVPESCCIPINNSPAGKDCGKNVFAQTNRHMIIFTHGCVTTLHHKLEDDVVPMLIGYAAVGVLLALCEIITVVIAAAYVAQIRRKSHREEKMWRHGTADHDGGGGDGTDAPLNHDTMV